MTNFDEQYRAEIRLEVLKLALDIRPTREVGVSEILEAAAVFEKFILFGLVSENDKKKAK